MPTEQPLLLLEAGKEGCVACHDVNKRLPQMVSHAQTPWQAACAAWRSYSTTRAPEHPTQEKTVLRDQHYPAHKPTSVVPVRASALEVPKR